MIVPPHNASGAVLATLLISATLALTGPAHATPGDVFRFTGEAREDGRELYRELHEVTGECLTGQWQPRFHQVTYVRPDSDEPFASKELDYTPGLLTPAVTFHQPDFAEKLLVRPGNGGENSTAGSTPDEVTIDWQPARGATQQFRVALEDSVVIDAGFDHLVRQNWAAITRDQPVRFRFLGPTRGEHYGFALKPAQPDIPRAEHVVSIEPTGLVTRLLVSPILLGYDGSGFLTDYVGLTNVRKNADTNYTAHIRYTHNGLPDCPLVP